MGKIIGLIPEPVNKAKEQVKSPAPKPIKKPVKSDK